MNINSSLFSDELNRRRFVSLAAKSFLGVSILPWTTHQELKGAGLGLNRPLNHAPKAKNVIYLYMSGMILKQMQKICQIIMEEVTSVVPQ